MSKTDHIRVPKILDIYFITISELFLALLSDLTVKIMNFATFYTINSFRTLKTA